MQSLGDRIKENYENRYRIYLTRRTPVILRLDGKTFHTLTKNCEKPFDTHFSMAMESTSRYVGNNIQGAKLVYTQSDEISILLTDFDRFNTDAWFDNNLQKIVSVSAAMASVFFSNYYNDSPKVCVFDSRAFNIPKEEVCNYFIWRQQDWLKNSVQMLARTYFSHKQLKDKKIQDMHEMLYEKRINWADLPNKYKNGCCYIRFDDGWLTREDLVFTKEREVVENLLTPTEE